jgi:nitrogen regulatory protein PII
VPDDTLEAFKVVSEAPEPTKLVADNVLDELSHAKFGDCNIFVVPFPINN